MKHINFKFSESFLNKMKDILFSHTYLYNILKEYNLIDFFILNFLEFNIPLFNIAYQKSISSTFFEDELFLEYFNKYFTHTKPSEFLIGAFPFSEVEYNKIKGIETHKFLFKVHLEYIKLFEKRLGITINSEGKLNDN